MGKLPSIGEGFRTLAIVFRNFLLGGNLISLFQITDPKNMAKYTSECLFGYKTLFAKRGIPQKNVFHVLPAMDVEEIKLGYLKRGGGWFLPSSSFAADIVSLCLICQILKPKTVFEIGTLRGYTAFHFALNTPDDSKIFTLDLPKDENIRTALETTITDVHHIDSYEKYTKYIFDGSDVASKITCLSGDSAKFDYSSFHKKVDFFFIDGAHSYDYVRSDTLNALKCCHSGSVVAWHDFGRMGVNGVTKWLLEFSKKGYAVYAIPGGSLAFMMVD
jgi:predicted O-methyltransferase YrrM